MDAGDRRTVLRFRQTVSTSWAVHPPRPKKWWVKEDLLYSPSVCPLNVVSRNGLSAKGKKKWENKGQTKAISKTYALWLPLHRKGWRGL